MGEGEKFQLGTVGALRVAIGTRGGVPILILLLKDKQLT